MCQKPIALHPVKEPREQLDWWIVLEAREHQGDADGVSDGVLAE